MGTFFSEITFLEQVSTFKKENPDSPLGEVFDDIFRTYIDNKRPTANQIELWKSTFSRAETDPALDAVSFGLLKTCARELEILTSVQPKTHPLFPPKEIERKTPVVISNANPVNDLLLRVNRRGGVVIKTSSGLIQLGAGMWTNKDALKGFADADGYSKPAEEIPHLTPTFIIDDPEYSPRDGFLKYEFMQYMPYVTRMTKHTLAVHDESDRKSLEGFLDISYLSDREDLQAFSVESEYAMLSVGRADLLKEVTHGFISEDTKKLREVVVFKDNVIKWNEVEVRYFGNRIYEIFDQGKSLGVIDLKLYPKPNSNEYAELRVGDNPLVDARRRNALVEGQPMIVAYGNSDGFDSDGQTSGHFIANTGKSVLVDPTSNMLDFNIAHAIPLDSINGIIFTHGHTDHFGDIFQKLLEILGPDITLYSTNIIYRMLLKSFFLGFGGVEKLNWKRIINAARRQVVGIAHIDSPVNFKGKLKAVSGGSGDAYKKAMEQSFVSKMLKDQLDLYKSGKVTTLRSRVSFFVNLFWMAKKYGLDELLNTLLKEVQNLSFAVPLLWEFQEVKLQQETMINGVVMTFDYTFHPVPALGYEIWAPEMSGEKSLVALFSGDTNATPRVFELVEKGVMLPERAFQILRHYFYYALLSDKSLVQIYLFFIQKDNPICIPPNLRNKFSDYLSKLSKGLKVNGSLRPTFLIEAGMPDIHTPANLSREFVLYAAKHDIDPADLVNYHINDKKAAEARINKWAVGFEGRIDMTTAFKNIHQPMRSGQLKGNALNRVPVFEKLSVDDKKVLMGMGETKIISAGETLLKEGEKGSSFYIVMDGELEIIADGKSVGRVQSGLVGEGALLGDSRNASVVATMTTTLLEINSPHAAMFLRNRHIFPKLVHLREMRNITRNINPDSDWGQLPFEVKSVFLLSGTEENYNPGQPLLLQGETTKDIFVMCNGSAQVVKDDKPIANLKDGDFIGELAFVHNNPRVASVIAGESGMKVLRFKAHRVKRLIEKYPFIANAVRRMSYEKKVRPVQIGTHNILKRRGFP